MKRMAIALFLSILIAAPVAAGAAELKAKGSMQTYGLWMDNWDFRSMKHGAASEDDFEIHERARMQFEFIANENLKGVVQLQIGNGRWGNGGFTIGQGDSAPALSTSLRTRQAYLTFNWPDTEVSVTGGYFSVALPGEATANRILDEEIAALAVSAPLIDDTLSLLAVYGRPIDLNLGYGLGADDADGMSPLNDEFDVFVLGFPVTLDGISFTPYGVYGHAGKDALNGVADRDAGAGGASINNLRGLTPGFAGQDFMTMTGARYTKNADAWWGGLAMEINLLSSFRIQADFVYGTLDTELSGDSKVGDREGWYADLAVTYTGLDMMLPELFFAYGSGDDGNTENGSERMPFLRSTDTGFGSFYYGYGSSFASADMSSGTGNDPGQWILGLGLTQITFLDRLSHDFYFLYVQGTNDARPLEDSTNVAGFVEDNLWGYYLTDKDHLFEVDFNTQYQVFEELAAILELGVIIPHLDKDVWHTPSDGETAFKLALGMKYSF